MPLGNAATIAAVVGANHAIQHQFEFYGFCSIHISTIACSCLPAAPQWMVGDNSTAMYRGGVWKFTWERKYCFLILPILKSYYQPNRSR